MRKWLAFMLFVGVFGIPFSARAQDPIRLTSLNVQLWPEYDQPSMLVIYDLKLPEEIKIPVNISIGIPADAKLEAVASEAADGSLIDTEYGGPSVNGNRQIVTLQIKSRVTYHLEYYEPLTKSGDRRDFTYQWPGDYAVDDLTVSLRIPVDTNFIVTDPIMNSTKNADSTEILSKDFGPLGEGKPFNLQINYTKTSDKLTVSKQTVQPSQPLSSNTQGRLMLTNYLPIVFGLLGVALIIGGVAFFWGSSRGRKSPRANRRHSKPGSETESAIYCGQCGTCAQLGDQFCRVCGKKLKREP